MSTAQSKKRGLSLEEKREKVLEIFHESKDVFQLKVVKQLYGPDRDQCQAVISGTVTPSKLAGHREASTQERRDLAKRKGGSAGDFLYRLLFFSSQNLHSATGLR